MKTMKLTTVALALIAAALFTTSAKAVSVATGFNEGDLILGFYDSESGNTNSYEVDLGAAQPTNGETWTVLNVINAAKVGATNLVFDIAADGGTVTDGGSENLAGGEIDVTAPGAITSTTLNTTALGNIDQFTAEGSAVSSIANGTLTGYVIADATTGSFAKEVNNNAGNFGFASHVSGGDTVGAASVSPSILEAYGSTPVNLDDISPTGAVTDLGTFSFNTTSGVLTFSTVATPEPSTYALMAGGLLALWMIKRRRSNA